MFGGIQGVVITLTHFSGSQCQESYFVKGTKGHSETFSLRGLILSFVLWWSVSKLKIIFPNYTILGKIVFSSNSLFISQ